jgi:hypothetical protein
MLAPGRTSDSIIFYNNRSEAAMGLGAMTNENSMGECLPPVKSYIEKNGRVWQILLQKSF